MERLTEGAQVFEKVRILKEEFAKKGDKGAIEKIDRGDCVMKEQLNRENIESLAVYRFQRAEETLKKIPSL